MVENQDFSTVETDQVLNEFKPETGKSVSTGNNNRELISRHDSFQYGSKPFPVVIETGTDVKDDVCFREERVEVSDLAGKIVSLFCTTDSAITDGVTAQFVRLWSFSKTEKIC
ncbi:hypothetical protein LYNGBM3L_48090 [Moorena producens 3L]|uniref:Uncharacterized protein n=1 Tax=Moorena producens 3L TaxID=489825 RepID=F4XXJ0_9CYAN|nr:hypothetical protein LYNGBM3L_48090 [Moorena producens 3L]